MRAPLALALTLVLAACSGGYGEVGSTEPSPAPAQNAPAEKMAEKKTDDTSTPAPPPAPPTKPTTYATCTAALSTIETCARAADVMPLGTFASLKTQLRPAELKSQCVGCDDRPCQMCHHTGTTRIFDYNGVWVPIEWVLACSVQADGSVGLERAGVLDDHEKSVAVMPAYSHPYYELNASLRASRDDAAALVLARLAKGECKP